MLAVVPASATAPVPSSRAQAAPRRHVVAFTGAAVVHGDEVATGLTVVIGDGTILEVGRRVIVPRRMRVDCTGLMLAPGLIDLHGDAFERAICPRPRVVMPLDLALRENDMWLASAGITTWFCSLTDSFEPGLRSRAMARALLSWLDDRGGSLACDTRVHLRHEVCLADGHDELLEWLDAGRIDLLSIADHLPELGDARKRQRYESAARRRLDVSDDDVARLVDAALAARERGEGQVGELCAAAIAREVPIASHDDASIAAVEVAAARGARICEFPSEVAVARRAREVGLGVVVGAPNLVRGGSHVGWMGAAEALAAGVVDAICSDYHYASLAAAPFAIARRSGVPLARAWRLASAEPARLAGLARKGAIEPGHEADLVLVDERDGFARVVETWRAGRRVYRAA